MVASPALALKTVSGPDAGRLFPLEDVTFVGREPPCEIRLRDPQVASLHVRIGLRGGRYVLTDLTRTSLVKVNGFMVKSRPLALGDRVCIGDTVLEVVAASAEGSFQPAWEKSRTAMSARADSEAGQSADRAGTRVVTAGCEKVIGEGEIRGRAPERLTQTHAESRHDSLPRPETTTYRHAVARPERDRKKERWLSYAWLAVSVLILGGVIGGLQWRARTRAREVESAFREVETFEAAHPEEVEDILEQYRQLRRVAQTYHPTLEAPITQRIRELEQRREQNRLEFETLLHRLDAQALPLAAAGNYEEAQRVYEVADPGLRARVAKARQTVLTELQRQAEEQRQRKARWMEGENQAAREKALADRLRHTAERIVDALLAARYEEADRLVERIITDPELAAVQDAAIAVSAEIRSLREADQAIRAARKEKNPGDEPVVPDAETRSLVTHRAPTIQCIYALRRNDRLEAEDVLRNVAPQHLLREALLSRITLREGKGNR